jgi:rhamnosyltransferase
LKVTLCIPTLNAAETVKSLVSSLESQSLQPDVFLVIDSGSTDNSLDTFKDAGGRVYSIPRHEFNHGGTRQLGVTFFPDAELIIFLTQDAILAKTDALEDLVACFDDERVGAAYGRQLPRSGAGAIEAHARLFNYPLDSRVKTIEDVPMLGIKTAFISNSFAAYRLSALAAVGGFPSDIILGEDTCVAARMILGGWKVAYCAGALVHHSHGYGVLEEFRRYFDIGVLHARERWLQDNLGTAEGEGTRFVRSELRYLLKRGPWLIPSALLRTALKLVGYKLGNVEQKIPLWLKRRFSMSRAYWK